MEGAGGEESIKARELVGTGDGSSMVEVVRE